MRGFWTRAEPRSEPTIISSQVEFQGSISACLFGKMLAVGLGVGGGITSWQKGSFTPGIAPAGKSLSQDAFKIKTHPRMYLKISLLRSWPEGNEVSGNIPPIWGQRADID